MKTLFMIYFLILFPFILISQNENWLNFNTSNSGIPINAIHNVTIDLKGTKWIGTWGGGLVKYDGKSWEVFNTQNSELPNDKIYSIAVDEDNNKWIGTFGGGIARFDNKNHWTIYDTSNSGLLDNTIYALAIDNENNKWIGTWGCGVIKFDDDENWTVFNTSNSILPYNKVPAIATNKKSNDVWIGTAFGLVKYSKGNFTMFDENNSGIPEVAVYSLTLDKNDDLWIGFKYYGVAKYPLKREVEYGKDTIKATMYNSKNSGLPSNMVYTVAVDSFNVTWAGTFTLGIGRFDGKKWGVIDNTNSLLSDDRIFGITVDNYNNKWISTLKGGLYIYNENGIVGNFSK